MKLQLCMTLIFAGITVISTAYRKMERATGIEPAYTAWKAVVLPLNYARDRCRSLGPDRSLVKLCKRAGDVGAGPHFLEA